MGVIRLEIGIGNPEINDIQKARKENHDKEQFKSNVDLKGCKQNATEKGQHITENDHKVINDNLDNGQNNHPTSGLVSPVLAGSVAGVNARVLNGGQIVLFRQLILYPEEHDSQYQPQRRVDQITQAIPGAFIFQSGFSVELIGQNGSNGLVLMLLVK